MMNVRKRHWRAECSGSRCRLIGLVLPYLTAGIMPPASAVSIQFDYSFDSSGFFAVETRRTLVSAAGNTLSTLLTDSLAAINPAGTNEFTAITFNPGGVDTLTLPNFDVPEDTLVVYVGGRNDISGLGFGGPGGFSALGSAQFLETVETRGQGAPTSGPSATEFAPWGGAMTFNSVANWYFDTDITTVEPFSGSDFYSVVLHELGHVLGIGTAQSWSNLITPGTSTFTGLKSVLAAGGPVALTTDNAHFASGTSSTVNGQSQEAAFDPSLSNNTRKHLTVLDVAALDDIGWSINGVDPSPQKVPVLGFWQFLLLGGLLISITNRGRAFSARRLRPATPVLIPVIFPDLPRTR